MDQIWIEEEMEEGHTKQRRLQTQRKGDGHGYGMHGMESLDWSLMESQI